MAPEVLKKRASAPQPSANYDSNQVGSKLAEKLTFGQGESSSNIEAFFKDMTSGKEDPYELQMPIPFHRKTTFAKPRSRLEEHQVLDKRPIFETLENVKRHNTNSVMMRPTLNSRGASVKRSVCGSPNILESTL